METMLEGTGLAVKGNCLIKELMPLWKSMQELISSDRNSIQIDLSECEAIDTAGVQLLAACRQSALEKGKSFQITSVSVSVREALELTGLASILEGNEKS